MYPKDAAESSAVLLLTPARQVKTIFWECDGMSPPYFSLNSSGLSWRAPFTCATACKKMRKDSVCNYSLFTSIFKCLKNKTCPCKQEAPTGYVNGSRYIPVLPEFPRLTDVYNHTGPDHQQFLKLLVVHVYWRLARWAELSQRATIVTYNTGIWKTAWKFDQQRTFLRCMYVYGSLHLRYKTIFTSQNSRKSFTC